MKIIEYYFSLLAFILLNITIVSIHSLETLTSVSSLDYEEEKWFWNKEEYPNPYEQPPYCQRTKPSYICDPDQLLTKQEANRLNDLIKGAKNVSACFCTYCPSNERGLSIGVALIRNIFKEYNVRELQNAENFADFLRKKWNFGICDNNILILIIASDNQIAHSEGTTTTKVFPKFLIDDTIKNNEIYFINENYYEGLEKIITTLRNILQKNIQYSAALEEDNVLEEEAPEEEVEESSHTGLIVGLIIGLLVFIGFIVFLLFYLRRRFSEDGTKFQFKGMLSRGYWLDKNERFRPVSVNPLNTGAGGVYEPCSIEEPNHGHNDVDKRLREKLSQISDGSGDEEEMQVIQHIPHSDPVNSANSVSHPTAHVSAPSVPT